MMGYRPDVPSLLDIRAGLRRLRRDAELTLDQARDRSGVDRAAIHKIENTKKFPGYEPGIDTVRKLVEGMGLTMSAFFARLEGGTRFSPTESDVAQQVARFLSLDAEARQLLLEAPFGPAVDDARTASETSPMPATRAKGRTTQGESPHRAATKTRARG